MIEYLKSFGIFLALTGLIFFIVNNAINTSNYKRKAIIFFLTGFILIVSMLIGLIYDYYQLHKEYSFTDFIFLIDVFILTVIFVTINVYKGNKYHHHLKGYKNYQNPQNNYLYIVYQYKGNYYLSMENDNYCGDIVKFSKHVYFHDQMAQIRFEQLNLQVKSKLYVGKISATENKKDFIFYCYFVELENDDNLEKFHRVDMLEVQNIKTLDFHKNIILRILIKEEFDIKL